MIRVRFHLARGANYQKWQIKKRGFDPVFHDPDEVCLSLFRARLVNRRSTAEKIYQGSAKSVCAWVECESVEAVPRILRPGGTQVSYNPRVAPHWLSEAYEGSADGDRFEVIRTFGKNLYGYGPNPLTRS